MANPNIFQYLAVDEVRDFCLSFADNVVICYDYLPHDFTVMVKNKF